MQVLDFNDNHPIITNQNIIITAAENQRQTNIATVTSSDADSTTNAEVEYVGIFPEGILSIDRNTGRIDVIGDLDYERRQAYQFVVIARDLGIPYLTSNPQNITLNVINENDNDPNFTPASIILSISEKTTVGTTILTVQATDNDLDAEGNIATYTITAGKHRK